MRRSYSGIWRGLAIIFGAVIYSIILFTLKKSFNTATWIAYGYTMIGFLVLLTGTCFHSRSGKEYPMFGLTSAALATLYFCVQFILGGIVAMVMPDLSPVTAALVGLILLSLYVIAVLMFRSMTSHVQGQDDMDGQKVQDWKLLVAEADAIGAIVTEEQLREKLRALQDTLRYSDPIGESSLEDLEGRIRYNISLLREEAEEGENEKMSVRIDKLQRLLTERNNKCRVLKKQ